MAGEPIYTYEEIEFILIRFVGLIPPAKIAVEYAARFGKEGLSRVRYVKNKYAKEARFGTPLHNWKNVRPAWQYEEWLRDHPPKDFKPEDVQKRKDAYFTPNGTSRLHSQGAVTFAPLAARPSKPDLPKTPTRARGRKSGATAAARTKSLALRLKSASSAAPTASMPDTAPGAAPGLGNASSYVPAAPTGFDNSSTAGLGQLQGQLPLPKLDQTASTDLYANSTSNSYLEQLTTPAPATSLSFPCEPSTDQWEFNTGFMDSQGFTMDAFDFNNGTMENQNGDDWDLNDPKFGDAWKDYLDFDFGILEPANTSGPSVEGVYSSGKVFGHGDPIQDSPTFYKSTLAEDFEMPATVEEGRVGEPLAIDPALFASSSNGSGEPVEDSAGSLLDLLNEDGAPDFSAEAGGEQGEGQGDNDPVLDEVC